MDILSNSINEKMNEIEEKIQKIRFIQEFDIARGFEKIFLQTKENIKKMKKAESQTHLYYHEAMDALDAINFEIDDYMEKEGKLKEQELNRTIFLEKLKRFIDDTKGKSSEQMLADLKDTVQEIKKLEIEEDLFSEMYSLTAKAALSTFLQQAQNSEVIDLGLVEEVTTKEAFAKEIQNQLATMAEEQKEDKVAAYDILKVCQEVNEQTIGDLKVWQLLSGDEEIKVKQAEPKKELPAEETQETGLISLEPGKRTIGDWFRDRFGRKDGTSIYTFGKFNEKTGQYENIRVEQHCFPPKGRGFIKRCQRECIELEINDVHEVVMDAIDANMPKLQSLSFGKNVCKTARIYPLKNPDEFLQNLKRVDFSDDVEMLDDYSFYKCKSLTDVKFGENIREIKSNCFSGCKLETIKLPSKLERISEKAFSDCRDLKIVKVGENVREIGNVCFEGCRNLQDINFPNKLSEIGEFAFAGCLKLQNINFPSNLSKIGYCAFKNCKNLRIVNVPNNLINAFYTRNYELMFMSGLCSDYISQAFDERSIFGMCWKCF